jgi:hypothetical protein
MSAAAIKRRECEETVTEANEVLRGVRQVCVCVCVCVCACMRVRVDVCTQLCIHHLQSTWVWVCVCV